MILVAGTTKAFLGRGKNQEPKETRGAKHKKHRLTDKCKVSHKFQTSFQTDKSLRLEESFFRQLFDAEDCHQEHTSQISPKKCVGPERTTADGREVLPG